MPIIFENRSRRDAGDLTNEGQEVVAGEVGRVGVAAQGYRFGNVLPISEKIVMFKNSKFAFIYRYTLCLLYEVPM